MCRFWAAAETHPVCLQRGVLGIKALLHDLPSDLSDLLYELHSVVANAALPLTAKLQTLPTLAALDVAVVRACARASSDGATVTVDVPAPRYARPACAESRVCK